MIQIFATYYKQEKEANTLIQSLICQTYEDWQLHICSNGDDSINNLNITDSRITTSISEPTEFWGCYNREEFRKQAPDSYLINSSVEDYYAPKTLEYLSKRSEDLVYWDFTHHHFEYKSNAIESHPRVGNIDWGNFAVNGALARRVPIPNCESYTADGEWVEALKRERITIHKIDRVLFVKN